MSTSNESGSSFTLLQYKIYGIPAYFFLCMALVIIVAAALGVLTTDVMGTLALLLVLGYTFGIIGDKLPIWKDWVGGGNIMAFLGSALLLSYGFIPTKYAAAVKAFMDKPMGLLNFFIAVLITGSIISVNRRLLIKSLLVYIPTILVGVLLAFILGMGMGALLGVPVKDVMFYYALPILGGGNGAGAIPMSQMWEQITGGSAKEYYSVAISILTIGDIISIVFAALLYKLSKVKPSLSGQGELVRGVQAETEEAKKNKVAISAHDIFNGLFLAGCFYTLAGIVAKKILPSIGGVQIHQYAYMIILVALCNALGVIPEYLRDGAKRMQKAFTDHFIWAILAGVGIAYTDFDKLLGTLTPITVLISAAIVFGVMLGPFLFSYLVGFFPYEAAVTAGLCMSARGGTGGVRVLGAAHLMNLISYGQISARLGGGIMLVIASILFSLFGKN